jgi:hypothetical protein
VILEESVSRLVEIEWNCCDAHGTNQKASSCNHAVSSLVLWRYARGTSWTQIPNGMGFHQTKKNLSAFAKQVAPYLAEFIKRPASWSNRRDLIIRQTRA